MSDPIEARVNSMRDHGYSQAAIERWLEEQGLIEQGQPLPSLTVRAGGERA